MEHVTDFLAILVKAVEDGRTVTIKADEVKVESGDVAVNALEITVE